MDDGDKSSIGFCMRTQTKNALPLCCRRDAPSKNLSKIIFYIFMYVFLLIFSPIEKKLKIKKEIIKSMDIFVVQRSHTHLQGK